MTSFPSQQGATVVYRTIRNSLAALWAVGLGVFLVSTAVVAQADDTAPAKDSAGTAASADEKPTSEKPTADKPADEKPAEAKPADVKPADAKPEDQKPADAKPAEAKPAEEKPAEAKPADEKPADVKPADENPAQPKPEGAEPAESKAVTSPAVESAEGGAAKKDEHGKDEHAKDDHGHAAGGGHHDETDLSHANATPNLEDLKELRVDLAVYTFAVFLGLFALLLKFGWKPITQGLDKREQGIRDLIAQAEKNMAESEARLHQYQGKLDAAAQEARDTLAKARAEAEQMRESIVTEARTAAQRERERAIEDIELAKQSALQAITQSSVDTAIRIAGRILRREVAAQDQTQLIREALEKFPSRN